MIVSIGATQFVFLSLGILALNVLLKAGGFAPNVSGNFPPLAVELARHGVWMYVLPFIWVAFAALCERSAKGFLCDSTARVTGVLVAAGIFGLYTYAASLFF